MSDIIFVVVLWLAAINGGAAGGLAVILTLHQIRLNRLKNPGKCGKPLDVTDYPGLACTLNLGHKESHAVSLAALELAGYTRVPF